MTRTGLPGLITFVTWARLLAASSLALLLSSCKEEEPADEQQASEILAEAYCVQLFDCTCADSAGFTSGEACFATLLQQLRDQQADAIMASLVYDAACVEQAIDRIETLACSRGPADLTTCHDCFVYHGLLPETSQCTRVGPFSTCDQGLTCVTRQGYDGEPIDVCEPACLRVGVGEICALGGPGYQRVFDCDEGALCDVDVAGVCFALPGPGMPCLDGVTCAPNAWCDSSVATPICAALKQEGEGCTTDLECASTWCPSAVRCVEPFSEGTPCVTGEDRCDVGLFCPPDYPFCYPTDAIVCQSPLTGF